jgi:cation diffusion facilitator family transporter
MSQSKRRRISGDLDDSILLIIYNDGPQSIEQLEEKTALHTINLNSRISKRRRLRGGKQLSAVAACEALVCRDWIRLAQEKYELTDIGQVEAEQLTTTLKQGAHRIETQILRPSAAARNSTVSYVVVSVLKLIVGLFSGSVGLIADGADTAVDTVASAIVWAGIKLKKEVIGTLVIIGLMFLTVGILFYTSLSSIRDTLAGTFLPITMPYVVIAVEIIVMISMFLLSFYQRFVGKRSQNFALISQSIDSKNSIYSAAAVIAGAVFSIFGIYWVDAVIGAIIAVRISIDGVGLIRETAKTLQGAKPEFSKFKLPFEKRFNQRRTNIFQHWIMHVVHNEKLRTKGEIVISLEKTFRPNYMPAVYTEFMAGMDVNFDVNFAELISPLLGAGYLTEKSGRYKITRRGKQYIKNTIDPLPCKQTEEL